MIIHLEVEWDDSILERFALVIAQQSLHFALQLNWILQGALQDYQPELADGTPNPTYNPLFFSRCLKLLKNVERCVVYGKPRAQELQRLYEKGKITKKELSIMEHADRRFNALQIVAQDADVAAHRMGSLDGWLHVQLPYNKQKQSKDPEFVLRYCVLEKHVLNCFISKGCGATTKLDRAMSLEKAKITEGPANTIRVETPFYEFRLQLEKEEEKKLWARSLREEAEMSALFQTHPREDSLKADLTPAQLDRYDFFQNERQFIVDLTQVAEDLRDKDRAQRKALAPSFMEELDIPPTVYLPLCNSSDIWRRLATALPKETRVFNTKERCPVVMHFISERGESRKGTSIDPNLDVAEYMHHYLEVMDEGMEDLEEEGHEDEEAKEEEDKKKIEDPLKGSEHSANSESKVWLDDIAEEGEPTTASPTKTRGNRRVQRLMRESVVTLPSMLAKRLNPGKLESRRRISIVDRQTSVQPPVPILEGNNRKENGEEDTGSVGEGTVVSVERSSVMIKDTILLGDLDEGDIDVEAIDRAKEYVSGGESWAEKSKRMLEEAHKELAQKGENVQLEIASCLAKSNDDLRQEVFVMQMLHYYKSVFAQAKLPLWLKTYRILSTSSNTGLLELLTDATSIDGLKKSEGFPKEGGLRRYFEIVYGGPGSKAFKAAQTNFMQSLAAYSLVSYLLGLKDRHNGNIMIDTRGHLIFIDFGFALGMKPGHEFSFERAPFKLTKEYIDVMDGVGSDCYKEFERLFVAGFEEARKNSQIALGLVEIMMFKSNYPCFTGLRYGGGKALAKFEKRLMLRVQDKRVKRKALNLIRRSKKSQTLVLPCMMFFNMQQMDTPYNSR